jgi:hypothetical protein
MGLSFLGLFVFSVPLWWFYELMNSFVHNWHYIFAHSQFSHCAPVQVRRSQLHLSVLIGIAAFFVLPIFPNETFPLVWISPLLLLKPLAYIADTPSCQLAGSIMIATLFTGLWWETWNYYSLPKWVYTIPYLGF